LAAEKQSYQTPLNCYRKLLVYIVTFKLLNYV